MLPYIVVHAATLRTFDWLIIAGFVARACAVLPVAQLIGNKSDLEHRRAVTYEEGEQFAKVRSVAVHAQ